MTEIDDQGNARDERRVEPAGGRRGRRAGNPARKRSLSPWSILFVAAVAGALHALYLQAVREL